MKTEKSQSVQKAAEIHLSSPEAAENAYESLLEEMNAIVAADFAPMNVDVPAAASIAMAVATRIQGLVKEAAREVPNAQRRYLERLADYAKAAWFAYLMNQSRVDPSEVARLLEEATALRGKLVIWADALVHSGIFDAHAVAAIREGAGNKDVAGDLVALSAIYRAQHAVIVGKCDVTDADIARAGELGMQLFAAVSTREQAIAPSTTETAVQLRRAWTLLDRAYNQVRRIVTYLRWDSDEIDLLVPSLRRNSGPRSSADKPVVAPAAPVVAVIGTPVVAASPAPSPSPNGTPIGSGVGPFPR